METLALDLPDAHCGACRAAILRALERLPGVRHAEVDLRTRTGMVAFDPRDLGPEAIVAALHEAGYPPRIG